MKENTMKALQKIASRGMDADATIGVLAGLGVGVPAGIIDYIKSGDEPGIKNSKARRIARAIAKSLIWGGGGFLAGYGANALSRNAGELPLGQA